MNKTSVRLVQSALIMLSLIVFLASLYFQYVQQMQPCPLCLMQRYLVGLIVILCSVGLWIRSRLKLFYGLQLLASVAGIYFASRQLWLQSLPADQMPACLPGLDILIRYFSLKDVLNALFWGTADCGEALWTWLGLSMAAWSLIYFLLMSASTFFLYMRLRLRCDL